MSLENRGSADSFIGALCMYRGPIFILFVISLLMFALSLVSFVIVEPGTGTYVIVVMNLVTLGAFLAGTGAILVACREKTHQ